MKISTKGRYALRTMVDIMDNQRDGFITLRDIAARQEISKKYLEQIALQLTQAGYLRAVRGHQGGYQLVRSPEEITVGEILRAVEGSLAPVACLETCPNTCPRASFCKTLPIWEGLEDAINGYLDGITLASLRSSQGNFPV